MLRFEALPDRLISEQQLAASAYLVGKDDMPRPGRTSVGRGFISASTRHPEAVALVTPYKLGDDVVYGLRTSLLPPKDTAYILPLELARHRLMLIIRKLEEWGLTGLSPTSRAMELFDQARECFMQSMTHIEPGQPKHKPEVFEQADKALQLAVASSGELSCEDSARGRNWRTGTPEQPLGLSIGAGVEVTLFSDKVQSAMTGRFDYLTVPLRWATIEADEGRTDYRATDRWIEWGVRKAKLPVVAGPVVELSEHAMPNWLGVWSHDYQQLREFVYDHTKKVVKRYRRAVRQWIATSWVNENAAIELSIDQMLDLTRLVVMTIHKLHPKAQVLVELAHPFGTRMNADNPGVDPKLFAEVLVESGLKINGFALRVSQGANGKGGRQSFARDRMALADMLDNYATLDKPLYITGLCLPAMPESTKAERQEERLEAFVNVINSRPAVKGACWAPVADDGVDMCGLLAPDGRPRPAFERLAAMRTQLRAAEKAHA